MQPWLQNATIVLSDFRRLSPGDIAQPIDYCVA
jgi:hypothetical protein